MTQPFDAEIEASGETLAGPWRMPRQLLAAQEYDGHASIHDDATAQKLGFQGSTASVGADNPPSALEQRLSELKPLENAVILRDVEVGMRSQRIPVRMDMNQEMGPLYPFSLADKLAVITEPSAWYTLEGARTSPWKRPIIPFEMIGVLCGYAKDADPFPVRGPVVGLFADQEIRVLGGPLFAGEAYELDREVVFSSGSRRTESMWVKTRVFAPGSHDVLAGMLLNAASLKDSYPAYANEASKLYGAGAVAGR